MWTPVNVGSRLMWTFHQERNRLYITCTKLLRLIWANIRLLWATQCQARVKTIRFTHVVHVYKFILAFAHEKTLSGTCLAAPGCCMGCFSYFHIRDKSTCTAAVMCMYSTYITVPTQVIVHTYQSYIHINRL